MANQLMFEVGIKEADNQLTELEKRLKNIVTNYGKLELKVQVDGLKAFTSALENIGQSKSLDALLKRIDVLQASLANVGMAGAKSIQEFEAAVKTTSAVSEQYTRRINEMTAARDRFKEGSDQWIRQNNKLTDFQNDKQVLAIYAQEQVAIKNLEEAKTRLGNVNNQEAGSYQKLIESIGTLNNAANTLKATLGSWDVNKGSISQLIEQFEKLHREISAVAAELKTIDPSRLNFSGIKIDVGSIAGVGDLNSAIRGLEVSINEIINLFSRLGNAVKLDASSEIIKKLQADADAAQKTIQELTEKMNALSAAQNNVAETAAKAGKSEQQIGDSQAALFNRYNKLLAEIQNIEREALNLRSSLGGNNPFADGLRDYIISLGRIRDEVKSIATAGDPVDAISKGMSSEKLAKLTSAFANLKSNFKEVVTDAKELNKSIDKGSSQAEARIRKLGMAFNELKNYMKQNGGSEEMKRLQTEIQGAIRKMRDLMNAGNFAGAINVYERLSGIIRQAATATKEFERAQQGVSSTVSHTNTQLMGQSQILSDLKSMAKQYLSVWGAQNFINNIIELGGKLEQQRLSIGAILQDTAQANHLFSQIKDLAIKSPFGVQQLDAMTKQLSAYGFQYSELYEWTKRLADISAATGTSVDRLALALGHVRSEGALSGYTLRQFSMGNIPLLQKLSENLGKTKQEIRKMTRNKEIGYEDVLNVLKQLTDEGGMFFEAQETMAQALNAKFKNLRDSFQIMYSEMAEGAPGDFLKGLATTLTDLSRQWQILMPMIGAAGAMWAMNKASAALVNVELSKMATLTNANTLASSKYSVAQLRQIANWEKMPKAMIRARLALQGFRTSLISLGRYVFSWPTAIFAAIEAITYMWAKQSREAEKAKEMTEVMTNTALESQKNLSKQLENIDPYHDGMNDSAMKTGIESMTEAIKNYGVNAQAVLEKVYGKDAEGRVMSLAEKYQYLRAELDKTADVYKELQRTSDVFQFGVEFSDGGWFDDDVQTDLTNYADAVKEYEDAFTAMSANYSHAVQKALEVAKNASPAFKAVADKLASDAERIKFLYEHQDFYGDEYNIFKNALHREDPNAGGGVLGYALGDNLRSAEREADKELDQFFTGVEEKLKKFGYDFTEGGKNLTEVQVGNLLRQSKEWLEKHPEWSNIYDTIWDKLNKRWGLPIVPEVTEIEEELPQWLQDFQDELNKTGIKLTANMSMEQIVDEMKKAYDKAQTTINKLGPIALQAKVNIQGLTDEDIERYNDPTSFLYNPELYNVLKGLKGANDAKSQVDAAAKKRGLKLEGMKKDGTHKAEKQNQENAKAVREQVRVIKEAADAFQYWREKVGDKGAWEHVQSEFGDVLKKIGITADNIEDVRGHLKRIPQMKEFKAITDKKVKTETEKELAKEEDQFIRKDFERDTERFLSKTQIELDSLTRSWETFNSVREATGNVRLAIELSGAQYAEGQTRNLADAIKEKIQDDFYAAGAVEIPFDINLSDKEIEEKIKKAMPKASETRIKGFVEEYKKWRDLQRDVLRNDIQTFSKILGSAVDYETQLRKINDELRKQIEANNKVAESNPAMQSEVDKANDIAYVQSVEKAWKATEAYAALYNSSLSMSRDELQNGINVATAILQEKMRLNLITAHEYAQEMEKIRKIMQDFDTNGLFGKDNGLTSYLKGGLQGLSVYYDRMIERYTRLGEQAKKDGRYEDWAQYMNTAANYEQAQKKLANFTSGIADATLVVDMAKGVLDGFQKAAQSLSNMFDALGKSGAAEQWSDIADTIGAITSTLNGGSSVLQNAMNGNIGGTISSILSAPVETITSPITAFAQLHDKKRERQIEDLKREVSKIDNTLNLIKSLRERELGYDSGNLRRQLAAQYQQKMETITMFGREYTKNNTASAMYEYYSRGGLEGNGYQQELNALKKQREMYQEMYETEEDKKKSSSEALEEYKQKMAELDITIMNYAKDLANELWSIDLKGWADQIGDSLMTAFENGTSAAEAFNDSVQDIMRQVLRKMLSLGVIEPMMKRLQTRLFGENGQGGIFDVNNPEGTIDAAMKEVTSFFGEGGEGRQMIDATQTFYDRWEEFMRSQGLTLSKNDSGSSTSSSIKGITEQTADILASLVNGIRADVSVDRAMIAQYFPLYYSALTSGNGSLQNIEQHTAAIMRSNDIVAERITSLDNNIIGLKNKTWKVPMA